jgi:phosphoglycolate phosphatase-like HAD superfamily hydrolase
MDLSSPDLQPVRELASPLAKDRAGPHRESAADRSDLLYVGDSVTMDVEGARAAGLQPVLLDPFDDHIGADFARIGSVGDLLNGR